MTWYKIEKGILTACARSDYELELFLPSILVVDEQERPPRFNDVSDFFEMKIPICKFGLETSR